MSEYDRICINMPQSAWMAFVLHFPISPFFLQSLSTQTHDYLFECLWETRGYSLHEHESIFLKRQNLIFSFAAGSIWFVFCFRVSIFTSKDLNFLLPHGPEGWGKLGAVNLVIQF